MGQVKDTHIKLAIKKDVDPNTINQGNVARMIIFEDDRNDNPEKPGDPGDWVSTVDKNMKVYWNGVSNPDKNISIKINEVVRKNTNQVRILKKARYSDTNKDGFVVGHVKNKEVHGDEDYRINFTINSKRLFIDPKLKMH